MCKMLSSALHPCVAHLALKLMVAAGSLLGSDGASSHILGLVFSERTFWLEQCMLNSEINALLTLPHERIVTQMQL